MNSPLLLVGVLIAFAGFCAWRSVRETNRITRTATAPDSLRQPCDDAELEDLYRELDSAALALAGLYPAAERTEP